MLGISNKSGIEIDRQRVLRTIGYSASRKPSARIASLIDVHIANAQGLVVPSYSYVIKNIEGVRRSCVFVEGSIVFRSQVIARMMEQCRMIAIFLVTIGSQLEEKVYSMAEEGLVLEASVLDAIGSSAAEKLAELVHDKVGEIAHSQGLCTSQRFSPGYCDWSLREQRMLFRAMDGSSTGVRLTKECLMLPRKSISGVIGIGPCDMASYNPCKTCKKRDCLGRRESIAG